MTLWWKYQTITTSENSRVHPLITLTIYWKFNAWTVIMEHLNYFFIRIISLILCYVYDFTAPVATLVAPVVYQVKIDTIEVRPKIVQLFLYTTYAFWSVFYKWIFRLVLLFINWLYIGRHKLIFYEV